MEDGKKKEKKGEQVFLPEGSEVYDGDDEDDWLEMEER